MYVNVSDAAELAGTGLLLGSLLAWSVQRLLAFAWMPIEPDICRGLAARTHMRGCAACSAWMPGNDGCSICVQPKSPAACAKKTPTQLAEASRRCVGLLTK